MQALKFKTFIDEKRVLSLTLPADTRPGAADVIVLLSDDESKPANPPMSDALFEELLHFGDGRTLGGLSIREMAAEGRK